MSALSAQSTRANVTRLAASAWLLVTISAPASAHAQENEAAPSGIVWFDPEHPDDRLLERSREKPAPVTLPGFRAPILGHRLAAREPATDAALVEAAKYVSLNLGREGIPRTLLELAWRFNVRLLDPDTQELNEAVLWSVGIPVDLLRFLKCGREQACRNRSLATAAHQLLSAGPLRDEDIEIVLRNFRFEYSATVPGFLIAMEDGSEEVRQLRMQLPLADTLLGQGDGTAADIFRQCALRLPDLPVLLSVPHPQKDAFAEAVRRWDIPNPARITAVAEPLRFTQWAQDNCKTGRVVRDGRDKWVTLVPRYASQGELAPLFMPSESYLFDSLAAAGLKVVQSPLLFQGGNLLPVYNRATKERLLFVGESEVLRNRALGLTREQVLEALTIEFGVDRCVVLPATSFHIDLEVTIRRCGDHLTAFVNDSEAASRQMVGLAIDTLHSAGYLGRSQAGVLKDSLHERHHSMLASQLWEIINQARGESGELGKDFALHFQGTPVESGSDNLKRVLLALDLLTALSLEDQDAQVVPMPQDRRDYYMLLREREKDRAALHAALRAEGLRVVPVPSLSDEDVSINYVNGVQGRHWYLMPAMGGYFQAMDDVARKAFVEHFNPGAEVVPIYSALTQRRYGGVHCSVSVYSEARGN